MILARFPHLLAIVAAFSTSPGTYPASKGASNPVELRIEVYAFPGLHVLTNRTVVDASADRYAIATDLDTRGIASVFVDLTSHSEVRGRVAGDTVVPEAYRSRMRRNGVERQYQIDYREGGPVASEWAPPASTWFRPFPPVELRGTVDQLTAYFIVERQLARRGSCTLNVPVFDGHGRYNLRFSDGKPEILAALGRHDFAGPTHVCDVTREDIADLPGGQDQSEGTYKKGKVWYARLAPGERMVPVRIEYDTEFGVVTGYLAELRGPGIDRRFME